MTVPKKAVPKELITSLLAPYSAPFTLNSVYQLSIAGSGGQRKTCTGLCHYSETLPVFDGTE